MNTSFSRKIAMILRILSLCSAVLLLAGCWDRKEVNDLALIMAAGIDKKEDKTIELSVQVVIPKMAGGGQGGMAGGGGGGGGEETLVRSAVGSTIAEAMSKLQEKFPRKIFWGHDEIIIFGEQVAKEGIRDHVDFLMRYPEARVRADVFISKGKAKDVLELHPPLERSSAEMLREMVKSRVGLKVTVKELAQMLSGEAEAAALPWIEKPPPESSSEKQSFAYINGSAVLKKDKMVGRINDKVTRGVLWLRNEIKLAVVNVTPKESEGNISLKLLRSKTELIPQIKDDKWSITIKTETQDDVIQNTTNLDLMNPKFIKGLEKNLNKDIENRVKMALAEGQKKMNADIFGFAEAFHRKYPKEWEKTKDHWDEVFPKIEVNIEAKAKVLRAGVSNVGATRPEKEVKKK